MTGNPMKKLILLSLCAVALFAQSYPGSVYTPLVAGNNVQTTLTSPMLVGDAVAIVAASTGWTANMVAYICDATSGAGATLKCTSFEAMLVTNVATNVLTLTRAYGGTVAAAHASGRVIANTTVAIYNKSITDEVVAIETALGANLNKVATLAGTSAITGTWNARGAAHTSPVQTGLNAAKPATCTTGDEYFATDATAGQNIFLCTAANTWTQTTTLPTASAQLQYLRVKPNTGNLTTQEFASLPQFVSGDYNFPTQAPGGSLSIGANTVSLTPCPLGVAGTDAAHYLYVSGGVGTAEAVLITGGTCTSGAGTGTVVFSAANTHTGAWNINSASSGIAEAINAATSPGLVYIPANSWNVYATITKPAAKVISIIGAGSMTSVLAAQFAGGDVLSVLGGGSSQLVSSIGFSPAVVRTSGAELHVTGDVDGMVNDIRVEGNTCYNGFVAQDFIRTFHHNIKVVNCTNHGVEAKVSGGGTVGGLWSDVNVSMNGSGIASFFIQSAGAAAFAGMLLTNISAQSGQYGIYIDANTGIVNELQFSNLQIDSQTVAGFIATGASGSGNGLSITNVRASPNGGKVFSIGKIYSDVTIADVTGSKTGNVNGIDIDGATGVIIENVSIDGSNNAGAADACINVNSNSGQATTNVSINRLACGRRFPPSIGINIGAAAHVGLRISNSEFFGTTAIIDANSNPTVYSGWIQGLSNTVPTVASAATVTFPRVAPGGQLIITGTTNVTAVAGLYAGQYGTLLNTGGPVYLVAGATIGNTVGLTPNVPASFFFDGTKIWVEQAGTLVSVVAATNSTASLGSTALLTAPTPGVYRVSWALNTGSVSGGSATSLVTIGWTDAVGIKSSAGAALTLAAAANQSGSVLVNVASGNIVYSTTYAAGTGGNYNLQLTAELVK